MTTPFPSTHTIRFVSEVSKTACFLMRAAIFGGAIIENVQSHFSTAKYIESFDRVSAALAALTHGQMLVD